MEVTPDKIGWT